MEDEQRRLKLLNDLQKYVPFLKSMIANLQNASKTQEKQRSPQLNKMMSLLALLTDQNKRLKVHTLEKCEDVLRKLYEKMESNKRRSCPKPSDIDSKTKDEKEIKNNSPLNIILNKLNVANSSAPASPSPPPFEARLSVPIIIPTERINEQVPLESRQSSLYSSQHSDKNSFTENKKELEVLYTRRSYQNCREIETDQLLLSSPNRSINIPSKISANNYDLYKNDKANSSGHKNKPLQDKSLECKKISVFDRLGEKLVPTSESSLNKNTLFTNRYFNEKVPKSATLITNLTKQLKEAQLQQEIASDIAIYLTDNDNKSNSKLSPTLKTNDSLNQSPEIVKKHEPISCGIKKSTPILKVVPGRKMEDVSIFGEVLSKIDKDLIDKVSKITRRKSTDTKQLKDDDSLINIVQSSIPTNTEIHTELKEKEIVPLEFAQKSTTLDNKDNCSPSIISKVISSNNEQNHSSVYANKLESNKSNDNFRRLSDKYPRKKISDGNLDQTQKNSPSSVTSPLKTNNNNFLQNSEPDHQNRSKLRLPMKTFDKNTSSEEITKIIKIPDVKQNDPRLRIGSSPMCETSLHTTSFERVQPKNCASFSKSQSGYSFPSILDMDYRFVPNQTYSSAQPKFPNANFIPSGYNNQKFSLKKPLLPTPNFNATNSNSNNLNNQDKFYSPPNLECNNTEFFNDDQNSRTFTNDYYENNFEQRDQMPYEIPENSHNSNNFNKNDFKHSGSRYQDNFRSQHRSANSYSRDNNYRWTAGRNTSQSHDQRAIATDNYLGRDVVDLEYKSLKENSISISDSSKSSKPDTTSTSAFTESSCLNSTKSSENKRTLPRDNKYTNNKNKHNERLQKKSSQKKNIHDLPACTKSVMKSFKIPKIKRNVEQEHENKSSQAATDSDGKAQISENSIEVSSKKNITQEINKSTDTSANEKEIENVSNEEKVLLTKLLDMISEIYKDKKEKQKESEKELNILQKLEEKIGAKKVEKIKQIIDGADSDVECEPKNAIVQSPLVKKTKKRIQRIESDSSDEDINIKEIKTTVNLHTQKDSVENSERKSIKPKRRNALEMLQHDVRDMFICEGVLTATGRRMCRALKEDNIIESNSFLGTEEAIKINYPFQRKPRKNLKKVNYYEAKNDFNSSIEEENINDEKLSNTNTQKYPRIILEKLENIETVSNEKQNIVRGRNVARRGRRNSSFMHSDRKSQVSLNDTETVNPDTSDCISNDKIVANLETKSFEKNVSEFSTDETKAKDSEHNEQLIIGIASAKKGIRTKINKMKKKIKRKGSWKMGIVRSKRRNKKMANRVQMNIYKELKNLHKNESLQNLHENEHLQNLQNDENLKDLHKKDIKDFSESTESEVNQIILNTDQNYYIDVYEKYPCKLCAFSGKMITAHYVHSHPTKEVYCSRINPKEVIEAKTISGENSQESHSEQENSEDLIFNFKCRFCNEKFSGQFQNSFITCLIEHLSLHTGEYRYMCNVCQFLIGKKDSLKHHFKYRHKGSKISLSPRILYDIPAINNKEIFGYLCDDCNFTQIFEKNVESHIKVNHTDKPVNISKISLYKVIEKTKKDSSEQVKENLVSDISSKNINEFKTPETKTSIENSNDDDNTFDGHNNNLAMQSDGDTTIKETNTLVDKAPFLLETNSDLDNVDTAFTDALINNTRPIFEPFIKKMTITDALQSKINNMSENYDHQNDIDLNNKVQPEHKNTAIINEYDKINDEKETKCNYEHKNNINIGEQSKDLDLPPDEINKQKIVHTTSNFEEAAGTLRSELRLSDDQDSNDSESCNSPQPSVNVNEVLHSFEKNEMTPGIMSNTIQRLASSLKSSPAKTRSVPSEHETLSSNELNAQISKKKDYKMTKEFILESYLPPSEPIVLNKVIKKSTKMKVGTIRISITSENIKLYECFEKGCVYSSDNDIMFMEHIENCHNTSKWNGLCLVCNKQIEIPNEEFQNGFSLRACFNHILKHDAENVHETIDIKKTKGFLKMRRLSGDKLSIIKPSITVDSVQDEDSFLKITSVVSLSTASNSLNESCSPLDKLPEVFPTESDSSMATINEKKNKDLLFKNKKKFYAKPWILNNKCVKYDFTDEMLVNIYKCMSQYCEYTCDDQTAFKIHLDQHRNLDFGNEYLECCYCDKICESILALLEHLQTFHKSCIYQCRHCFYRCFCKVHINTHIDTFHKAAEIPNVIQLKATPEEIKKWKHDNNGNLEFVLSYCCKYQGCNFTSKSKQNYSNHLQTHDLRSWECFICNANFSSLFDYFKHTEWHSLNTIQCCYCIFGASDNDTILKHITDYHSGMPASVFLRIENMNQTSRSKEVLKCNFDVNQLLPCVFILNTHKKTIINDCANVDQPQITEYSETINNDISSDSDNDNLIIDETQSVDIVNFSSSGNEKKSKKLNNQVDCMNNSTIHCIERSPCINSESQAIKSPQYLKSDSVINTNSSLSVDKPDVDIAIKKNINKNCEIEKSKYSASGVEFNSPDILSSELNDQVGIENKNLFKCKCDAAFESSQLFKQHLNECSECTDLKCLVCDRSFVQVHSYVEHLKIHGIHRYSCGLCKFRSTGVTETKLHLINKHKETSISIVPVDPLKTNPDTDFFICKAKRSTESTATVTPSKKSEVEKSNSYSPNDIDKLPRNSIYFKDVECALCPFKTKVRTNIIRHLQQHKSDNTVPEVCPVNPVPCLTTNEKYFDKMKNLACSSHINKTEDDKVLKDLKTDDELPKFINESKRFVCGIIGCTYLTVNEEMLRHHYLALHAEETCYICPHCPNNLQKFTGAINIDKIISHLKLHDTKLYKCPYCNYHKSQKHVVERHISDKHVTSANKVIVIREDLNNLYNKPLKRDFKRKTWMCGLCDHTAFDKVEITKHCWEVHGMKSQFKCGLCQFRCSYKNSFKNHFASRHAEHDIQIVPVYKKVETELLDKIDISEEQVLDTDTTPLWSRDNNGLRHIRGILLEEEKSDKVKQSEKKNKLIGSDKIVENNSDLCTIPAKRKRSNTSHFSENLSLEFSVDVQSSKNMKLNQNDRKIKAHEEPNKMVGHKRSLSVHQKQKHDITLSKKPKLVTNSDSPNTKPDRPVHNDIKILLSPNQSNITEASPGVFADIICLSSDEEGEPSFLSTTDLPPLLDETRYGDPVDNKYRCSFCEEFVSSSEHEMFGHLCNELQYVKYSCKICNCVSWDIEQLASQCKRTHPNTNASINELKKNEEMENWISRAIEHQRKIIFQKTQKKITKVSEPDAKSKNNAKDSKSRKSGDVYSCRTCSYQTKFIGYFERHQKTHLLKLYNCSYCSMVASKKQIEAHIKHNHPDKEIVMENYPIDVSNEDCTQPSEIPLNSDNKNDGQKRVFLCYYCPKKGYSINDIQEHWKITHKNPKYNSDGKITKYALQFQYKITTEEEYLKKIVPKNIFSCEHCGKRGYLKVMQIHHKAKHPDLSEKIVPCTNKPGFKCDLCGFFVYLENLIKKHFNLIHPGVPVSYTETFIEDSASNKLHVYKCNYCNNMFNNLSDITEHHEKLHSHKNLVLNVVNNISNHNPTGMRQYFKCPMCTNAFEAFNDTCQHIETHIKPFSCNYCLDGFSFTDTVKLHIKRVHPESDITNYSAVPNTEEKIQEAISSIEIIYKNCQNLFNNECKKMNLFKDDENSINKTVKSSSLTTESDIASSDKKQCNDSMMVRAVAKKSTTMLPKKIQVAKKSTTKQNLNNDDIYQSHYKNKIIYDNTNIHTVVSLGAKPIRLNIENLEAITNIHPTLNIVDIRSQLNDETISTNILR